MENCRGVCMVTRKYSGWGNYMLARDYSINPVDGSIIGPVNEEPENDDGHKRDVLHLFYADCTQ
ncbi:CGH_3_HP_G0030900.mRNA.1.CDS.1 [Saccharomyces cerevisiae]|nr:CGH_3_HP_G0030900.mRNA.1.CDS.1 [Saccharomyces cerevisiae]CAI6466304.1 CGH_3_HP_G0030900.mRNA.1.CDS.1 [Saccharomyces cerevisiae]